MLLNLQYLSLDAPNFSFSACNIEPLTWKYKTQDSPQTQQQNRSLGKNKRKDASKCFFIYYCGKSSGT